MADALRKAAAASEAALPVAIVGDRFRLLRKLGAGGMGEVYLAYDESLKREVALKCVTGASADTLHRHERLRREAERGSRINHPHVAAVYDVLDHGGDLWLVLEYVDGVTLRDLQLPLSMDEWQRYASQAAAALQAAHACGVIHGDIKPENIMVTRAGALKVLDFGVARASASLDARSSMATIETLNSPISGTLAYMAPEVLRQEPADSRADLFSLGAVLYELLTARHPFEAKSFFSTAARILHDQPVSIRELNPGVPPTVAATVHRLLEKSPTDRFQTAGELLAELQTGASDVRQLRAVPFRWRTVAAVVAAVALLLVGFVGLRPSFRPPTIGIAQKHVAVLPFEAVDNQQETQAFGRGLAEAISTRLVQLTPTNRLQVVPPSEIRTAAISNSQQAREQFGVNLVLEGSVQRAGEVVRINYRLVDATSRRQVKAGLVTGSSTNPFLLEDDVVAAAARALELELERDPQQSRVPGDLAPTAHDFYLRGRGYLQDYHRPENIEMAIGLFERALAADARHVLAHAALGESYWQKYLHTHDAPWLTVAEGACTKAVSYGPSVANGYICLGTIASELGNHDLAVEKFQRAVSLDESSDDAYRGLALAYERLNNMAAAESTFQRAIRLRPHYWASYNMLGRFYIARGRLDEAEIMLNRVLELAPDNFRGYSNLGAVYIMRGDYIQARKLFQRSVNIRPTPAALSNLGACAFFLRDFDAAAASYSAAAALDSRNHDVVGNLAEAYYWIPNHRAAALSTYRRAIELAAAAERVNPNDPELLASTAIYHAMTGEAAKARQFLNRARRLAPTDAEVLYSSALVATRIGSPEQARAAIAQAISGGVAPTRFSNNPLFDRLVQPSKVSATVSAQR